MGQTKQLATWKQDSRENKMCPHNKKDLLGNKNIKKVTNNNHAIQKMLIEKKRNLARNVGMPVAQACCALGSSQLRAPRFAAAR